MTDPVAILTGDKELKVDDGDREVPDAPAREPSHEEVSHDEGIEEQLAKKQGPWPASNRTQVERDAMWRAAPGAEDPVRETEDVSPVPPEAMEPLRGTNPPSLTPDAPGYDDEEAASAAGVVEEVERMVDRINQDLDVVQHLRDELDQVAAKARKLAESPGPETLQERLRKSAEQTANPYEMQSDLRRDKKLEGQQLLAKIRAGKKPPLFPSIKRASRICKDAGWPSDGPPKGIGLPSEVRPANQAFIDSVNDMSKAADDWTDQGWWYEKEFKVASNKREPFKTALFLELAGTGERSHQFTTADTDGGVLVKVDRTERGLNPQFTKMANQVYETFDPSKLPVVQTVEQRKVAGEIRALVIRKTMIPREDRVCPHCAQMIGEKESFWPEEFRDHPTMTVMRHSPCGGLYSQEKTDHQALMEQIPGLQPGEWHDHSEDELNKQEQAADAPALDLDRMLANLYERHGECPRCARMYHECTCSGEDRPEWPESAAALIKELTKVAAEDELPGGVADNMPDSRFDPEKLEQGEEVELEHTDNPQHAEEITKDHLAESGEVDEQADREYGEYYDGLAELEKKIKAVREHGKPLEEVETPEQKRKLLELIRSTTNLDDGAMHERYMEMGLDPHEAEEWIYAALQTALRASPNIIDPATISERETDGEEQEKTAADKPFRRRVEVIITDGLNVWGEKKEPSKGGVWFPGGGVDTRGEKFADAAAREVVEESGFEVDEIYRLARIKPCECRWDDSVVEQADGKWEEKAKQYKGDRTHIYVATIKSQGRPTSQEGDAMPGEWMKFSDAIRKLRNAVPHDNQGWKPLTRARLNAVETLAPSGLKVPRRGDVEEIVEEVTGGE